MRSDTGLRSRIRAVARDDRVQYRHATEAADQALPTNRDLGSCDSKSVTQRAVVWSDTTPTGKARYTRSKPHGSDRPHRALVIRQHHRLVAEARLVILHRETSRPHPVVEGSDLCRARAAMAHLPAHLARACCSGDLADSCPELIEISGAQNLMARHIRFVQERHSNGDNIELR